MKRKLLLIFLAFGLTALVSAQGGRPGPMAPRLPAPEAVTVSGNLIVAYGTPAVKSGDVTYIIGGINRLLGFVDGLKEGAQVTLEGMAISSPRENTVKVLRATKLTLGGKTYDLARPNPPSGSSRRFNPPPSNRQFNQPRFNRQPAPKNRKPRQALPRQNDRRNTYQRQDRSGTL